MEIEEGGEGNYVINKEEIIEDDKQGMRDAYVINEDESNENEKQQVTNKVMKLVIIVWIGSLMTLIL